MSLVFIHNRVTKGSKDRWLYHRLMLYILVNTHTALNLERHLKGITHLFWQDQIKTSQTFKWTIEQSEQTIREEDKTFIYMYIYKIRKNTQREKLWELAARVHLTMLLAKVWVSSDLLPAGHRLYRPLSPVWSDFRHCGAFWQPPNCQSTRGIKHHRTPTGSKARR